MRHSRSGKMALLATLALGSAAGSLQGQVVRMIAQPGPPAAAGGAGPISRGRPGLHISSGKRVSLPQNLKDGAGYLWDIQRYGSITQGTGRAYSGGLYLYLNNSRLSFSGQGWINAAGDEIETPQYSRNNLRISRRIKVYRDRGMARWLDIYENTSSQAVAVKARLYSDMITTVSRTVYSSGESRFTGADTAFVTVNTYSGAPSLLHYVCSKRSKVRPTVTVQGDDINVYYNFTVPARKTVVVCYFESQNRSATELTKLMKSFRPARALRDLPFSVRKLLINMPAATGIGGIVLERSATGDLVYNTHGDPIFGTIGNESFRFETFFGPMTIPAGEVIGLAAVGGEDRRFRALLAGGQIIAGQMPEQAAMRFELPSGGKLSVPFAAVRQCAYRVSKDKPDEVRFAGPLVILRTGDRVAFRPGSAQLKFRTRHGTVGLDPNSLLSITLDNAGNAVHRANFLNGSQLAGLLEPARIPLTLKLGPKLTIRRHLIAQVQFAEQSEPDTTLDAVTLSNNDELFGRLAEESLTLETKYGKVTLSPENIRAMSFSRTHLGRMSLRLWDGSILRGQCGKQTLAFQIMPGPTLDIHVGQYVQISRKQALPPKRVRERLEHLVRQLGAESYKDRQAATDGLVKMGKGIVPMLRESLAAGDPEVRQRITIVLERLGAGP